MSNKQQYLKKEINFFDVKIDFVSPKKSMVADENKKRPEWLCQGVPCAILYQDETNTTIKPFNKSRSYNLSNETIKNEFNILKRDENFVYAEGYPSGKIDIIEFTVTPVSIKNLIKYYDNYPLVKILLEKAEQDAYHSKGMNDCITVKEYLTDKNTLVSTDNTSKLERIGDPILNRSTRHTIPIPNTYTREEFEENPSYPAPLGIRESDFAFPSEQNAILRELIRQIFCCVNAPELPPELKIEYGIDSIIPSSHCCEWCGELVDISKLNQEYCSKEHSINFCHRDPAVGTKNGNVYIGHCSCNREQGGYSETERVQQILRIANYNPIYREMIMNALKL